MVKITEIKECFQLALRNLRSRSLRSWLTIFGIVIGVFLIISLLSLSEGLKQSISRELKSLGGEMIFILPGDISNMMAMFTSGAKLEKEDIETIERTRGVETVLSTSYQSLVVRYGNEGKMVFINGLSWEKGIEIMKKFQGWSLKEGEWPTPGKREVIIGKLVKTEIFEKPVKVDSEIIIKGKKFKVVGILNSLGSKYDDSSLYLDLSLYQDLTGEKRGTAQMAMVKVREGNDVNKVAKDIKENLIEIRKRRVGTDVADFSVITSEKMEDIASKILAIVQFVVIVFASIAIVVGGIGITNTMFTSVRERTREIGIMKAVGAKNSVVLSIFLIEAGIIGIIGGLGGTLLGAILAKAIEIYGQVHPIFYLSASITPGLIIFGLVFSLLVGCLSGFFPARKAAQLKPVEALRRFE
ncbi:MAG: ABC transporter permease [Patescibacteria group bacterium]|nr:ABC transporter permease [Patescibacteria group bacterium]